MVEVMVCPSGCVNGGGINNTGAEQEVRERLRMIARDEDNSAIPTPADNLALQNFYEKWPAGNKELQALQVLRNNYTKKNVLL